MKAGKLLGILDIGTNSVMLTVGIPDLKKPLQLTEFFEVTRLGEKVNETGFLQENAVKRTLNACKKFVKQAYDLGVRHFTGTATSAARDAKNGVEFLDSAEKMLGFRPQILSGAEEARLVFLGSTADLKPGEKVITADPGGGSTEINIGVIGQDPHFGHSFNAGCVRHAEKYDLYEIASDSDILAAREELATIFSTAFTSPEADQAARLVISGGTSTTFGAVKIAMTEYDWRKVHHLNATLDEVDSCCAKLLKLSSKKRAELPGLSDGRATVLPTGLLIISELLKGFKFTEFTITTRALRYGMLIDESRKLLN